MGANITDYGSTLAHSFAADGDTASRYVAETNDDHSFALPSWDATQSLQDLPEMVRQEFSRHAAYLRHELREKHLVVVLTPAPVQNFTGHMVRSVEQENAPWYKALWEELGNKLKRYSAEEALDVMALGEGSPRDYVGGDLDKLLDGEIKNPQLRRELRQIRASTYISDDALAKRLVSLANVSRVTYEDAAREYRMLLADGQPKNSYLREPLAQIVKHQAAGKSHREIAPRDALETAARGFNLDLRKIQRLQEKWFSNSKHLAIFRQLVYDQLIQGWECEGQYVPPNEVVVAYFQEGQVIEPHQQWAAGTEEVPF